jgi:hypothetical protein
MPEEKLRMFCSFFKITILKNKTDRFLGFNQELKITIPPTLIFSFKQINDALQVI